MTLSKKLRWAAAVAAAAVLPAHAALVFDASDLAAGGPLTVFGFDSPTGSGLTTPVDLGGVVFSTTGGRGSLGEAPLGAWVLGSNGVWSGGKTFAGVDGDFDAGGGVASMSFDFGALRVRGIGGFMNYDPDFTYGDPLALPLPLYIAAYGAGGTLLEDYEVPVFTPDGFNAGVFYGILRDAPEIARFVVSGPYAVIDDLTFTAPVPEPSTYALLLAGLGLLAFAARRRRAG
jgi:hypothetical protein